MINFLKKSIKTFIPNGIIELIIEKKRQHLGSSSNIKKTEFFVKKPNVVTVGNKKFHTFFGYYDISPFNEKTNEIIYLRINRKKQKKAEIFLHDLKTDQTTIIATTAAWNWQQGSRLRWFPNSTDEIIFNDYQNGRYISKKINVRNNDETIIDYPIYDIDNQGKYAVTLNFERLGAMRPGYGYANGKYETPKDLGDEGIFKVDIIKNRIDLLLTYKQIGETLGQNNTNFNNNYINHLSYSPSGNKFLFFWLTIVNRYQKAFLLVYDLKTKKLTPLETEGKVSHYVWLDDNCILCTTYNSQNDCRYYKYWIDGKKEIVNPASLTADGHPSCISNDSIITDTYPDKNGYQKIIKADIGNDKSETIAKIYSRYKIEQEKRTDLHPRLNKTKKQICFDANIKGYRQLFVLNHSH